MNDRTSTIRRFPLLLLAIFAFVSASLFVLTPASTQRRTEGRGADLRPVSSLPSKEKRWALIIGVNNYQGDISPLLGSVNDAKALKEVLVKYAGFPDEQVVLLTTDASDTDLVPNRGNILDALDKLSRQVPEGGLLLFSFSGHGYAIDKDDAFLVPADGRIYQNVELMRERSIDVLRIRKSIQATRAKQVLMFLDMCRNDPVRGKGDEENPLTRSLVNGFSFDTRNERIDAFATIYATSIGDRAFEFYDERTRQYRGFFSYAIEEALSGKAANKNGEVTLGSLIKYLENTVAQRVHVEKDQRQIPYPVTEGFRNDELVLAIANKGEPKSRAAIAWENFSRTAKRLLKYDDVAQFSEGFARARIGDNWGYIDKAGETALPAKYEAANQFTEGLAAVRLNKKVGYIDKTGRLVIPHKYDYGQEFNEGLVGVALNDKWGFIDKSGRVSIPLKYAAVSQFAEGLAAVSMDDNTYNFIDRSGNVIIQSEYESADSFSEGLAKIAVSDDSAAKNTDEGYFIPFKYGFIDKTGRTVIKPKYNDVGAFSEGLAVIVKDDKQGFINRNGREVISLKYDVDECGCGRGSFFDGLAMVILNKKFGFIDTEGREVIPLKYDDIWCIAFRKEGFIGVELNGRKGFVDTEGNEYFNL